MLGFDFPWLFAALPLPLVVWWLFPPYREVSGAVRIPFFAETAQLAGVTPTAGAVVPRASWMQRLLAPCIWLLVVAALARPQWLEPPLERTEPARDLLIAIDLSQSMEARDFVDATGAPVDRLTAVKGVVDEFIARRPHDRIGLIVFGQAAFPQAPLTLDHAGVRTLLGETRIGMAGPQTAIGDAIGVAVRMTETSPQQDKVLVLLTDGNDTASRIPPPNAAVIAKAHHIVIHTIGIGDPKAEGEEKVDLDALGKIATATGGRSFRGEDRAGLERIYATIDELAPDQAKRTLFRPRVELYWMPLAVGALLLVLYHAGALAAAAVRRRPIAADAETV